MFKSGSGIISKVQVHSQDMAIQIMPRVLSAFDVDFYIAKILQQCIKKSQKNKPTCKLLAKHNLHIFIWFVSIFFW